MRLQEKAASWVHGGSRGCLSKANGGRAPDPALAWAVKPTRRPGLSAVLPYEGRTRSGSFQYDYWVSGFKASTRGDTPHLWCSPTSDGVSSSTATSKLLLRKKSVLCYPEFIFLRSWEVLSKIQLE